MVAVNRHVWTCQNSTHVAVSLDTVWILIEGSVQVTTYRFTQKFVSTSSVSADIDECLGSHSDYCDDVCVNTEGSFHCTCRESFVIATDGRSCVPVCGGHITIESGSGSGIDNDNSSNSGSISTPGWPEFYPSSDFTCEWTFEASNNSIIEFIFEDRFGIRASQSCATDYVDIFDGYRNTGSSSLGKFCTLRVPESVSTSSNFATIVFQASSQSHSAAHVGANITYTTLEKGTVIVRDI